MMWLLQYDVSLRGPTEGQYGLAVLVVLGLLAFITFLLYRGRYAGLPPDRKAQKATLLRERWEATPVTTRIPAGLSRSDVRERVLAAAESAQEGNGDPDRISFRDAVAQLRGAIAQSWTPVFDRFPTWSVRVAEYGAILGVAGALALESEWIAARLEDGTGTIDVGEIVDVLVEVTVTFLDLTSSILLSFPYVDVLWALALTLGIQGGAWLYEHWYVTAPTIVFGALVVAYAEYRLGDDVDALHGADIVSSHWGAAASVVGTVVVIWLAGVVPTGIGMAAGRFGGVDVAPTASAAVGLLLALVILGYNLLGGLRYLAVRGRRIASLPDGASKTAGTWLLVRHVWTVLVLSTAPILAAYVGVIVLDGSIPRVVSAFFRAGPEVHAAAVLAAVLAVVTIAYQARSAWPDFRLALRTTMAKRAHRAKLIGQGVPLLVWAIAYIVGYAFTGSIVMGLLLATVFGLAARGIYTLLVGIRHRAATFTGTVHEGPWIVEVYPPLFDDDNVPRYAARIDGDEWLLADSMGHLATDVSSAIDGGEPRELKPVTGMSRAEAAFEAGVVDAEAALAKLDEKARKHLFTTLRPVASLSPASDLDEALEELPEDAVERVKERHDECFVERDEYVELVRDPYGTG